LRVAQIAAAVRNVAWEWQDEARLTLIATHSEREREREREIERERETSSQAQGWLIALLVLCCMFYVCVFCVFIMSFLSPFDFNFNFKMQSCGAGKRPFYRVHGHKFR